MSDIFISYARSTEDQARRIGEALRALGYGVWRDDELPAHRAYAEVIEERLNAARAVLAVWSAEAARSQWVRAEADLARGAGKLVQLSIDGAAPPMPFNQIQCPDLTGWAGEADHAGWRRVVESLAELVGGAPAAAAAQSAGAAPAPAARRSIAVLPFADLSPAKDQGYFAEGMAEAINNALSRFRTLSVIAYGGADAHGGAARDTRRLAAELSVRYLLDGSVQKAGERVRISARLLDAAAGRQIWSERFDDTLEDVFDLQDRVAMSAAGAIDSSLLNAEVQRALTRPTQDLDAYDLFLRGWGKIMMWDRASIEAGVAYLEAAVARDADYAAAWAFAGYGLHQLWVSGWTETPDACRARALACCRAALAIDHDDPLAQAITAATLMGLGEDIGEADRLAERALETMPGSVQTLIIWGWIKAVQGGWAAAMAALERAMRLDPRSLMRPHTLGGMAVAQFAGGQYEAALASVRAAEQALPEYPATRGLRIACLMELGRDEEAREAFARHPDAFDHIQRLVRERGASAVLERARRGVEGAGAG